MKTISKKAKPETERTTISEKEVRELEQTMRKLRQRDLRSFRAWCGVVAALAARYEERPQLADGSSSPIAEDVPVPQEVDAAIAMFSEGSTSDPEGRYFRELIARHRALPAPAPFQPITDAEVAQLCRRFPGSAIHIFASRRFAECVRLVTALYDEADGELTEEFEAWLEGGEDTTKPPGQRAPAPLSLPMVRPTHADPIAAEVARRFMAEDLLSKFCAEVAARQSAIRAQVEAEFAAARGSDAA